MKREYSVLIKTEKIPSLHIAESNLDSMRYAMEVANYYTPCYNVTDCVICLQTYKKVKVVKKKGIEYK